MGSRGSWQLALAVAFLTLFGTCAHGKMVELTDDNFHDTIRESEFAVVLFYAKYCAHCKRMLPEWENAAMNLGEESIMMARLNAPENLKIAKEMNVRGFPTISWYSFGKPIHGKYSGPRDAAGIVKYLKTVQTPVIKQLYTKEEVQAVIDSESFTVMAVVDGTDHHSHFFQTYQHVAKHHEDKSLTFYYVTHGSLLPLITKVEDNALYIYKHDEGNDEEVVHKMMRNPATVTAKQINSHMVREQLPLVVELNKIKGAEITNLLLSIEHLKVLGFTYHLGGLAVESARPAHVVEFRDAFWAAARKFRDVKFVIGDVVDNENILKFFSLAPQEVPALVIHDTDGKPDRRWVYANATVEGMEPWIQDVLDGKVERTPKSALPPDPKNNTGPVTIVVGTTYHRIVHSKKKYDVLILFCSKTIKECKALGDSYTLVGDHFAREKPRSTVVAFFDFMENDLPDNVDHFHERDFPGIYHIQGATGSITHFQPRKPDRPPDDLTVATLQAADEIISFADTFASPKKLTKNDEL
mmetsp:Transcript_26598/g.85274  ORF Transcript_26598/g.85274 Transcript_26598/m.85274 type:complete len:525 (+) Transcript_26598:193-1767(+)